jgi:ABC-type branched-subunit amino acid transport system substrate-binding protein
MKRSKLIVLAAALALVAGACRGSGGDDKVAAGKVSTDIGVTEEPCPNAVNKEHGCIYLGIISDLTKGPFAPLAVPLTDAQKAFWAKVNRDGGIGGFDIDVTTYIRDNEYTPAVHKAKYDEIKGKVLALAQTLGSPQTAAIINDLAAEKVVAAPASWTSAWLFQDVILETGATYCVEAMNSIDWAVAEKKFENVMAVHYAGDAGDDAAAGARIAAERNKIGFDDVKTTAGQENQAEAIGRIIQAKPDLVYLAVSPTDMAVIVGQAVAKGYKGQFIGYSPSWNPGLLKSPAAAAVQAQYLQAGPLGSWGTQSAGHAAMREALGGGFTPNDGAVAGWAWSYPMKAALEAAVEAGDVTRAGLMKAVEGLESVDFEGMYPEGSGNYAGEPNEAAVRQSLINKPDPAAPTGVSPLKDYFVGDTAKDYEFTKPCFG